jgi:molybdenum cofactor cytidylyltransferase
LTESVSAVPDTAAIVLAAGAATRMGQLKQMLAYQDGTLLQHAIDQAIGASFEPIIVVLGSKSEMLRDSIANKPVEIVRNESWETGMGSSIGVGIQALLKRDKVPWAAAILVADQPLVETRHLAAMRQLLFTMAESSIVAAEYNGTIGVPAIFRQGLFEALLSLPPGAGARNLLRGSDAKVTMFPLPEAAVDIDTPEDFEAFTSGVQFRLQK